MQRGPATLLLVISLLGATVRVINGRFDVFAAQTSTQSLASRHLAQEQTAPWAEQISAHPRAYVYHNFLSPEECDHIVALAKPRMKRSTVVGKGGQGTQDEIRTSYGTFLRRLHDPVVHDVELRLAKWSHLNISHQEDMQILRYGLGQKYGAHYDSLVEDSPRVATVLLYLANTTQEGGETAFPAADEWVAPEMSERFGPFSECAKQHVAVKPQKGMALLFYSLNLDGSSDSASLHTGCPILQGVKWTATKWIHTKPFRPEWLVQAPEVFQDPEECEDLHKLCSSWAKSGECKSNVKYMEGDDTNLGMCRRSCDVCTVCAANDLACRSENRIRAGYLPVLDM
ncbi:hypothetical protein ABBQ38_013963 [Trebouxia sp. C0009 RCD-2024]